MFLTNETDYAIRIVTCLAESDERLFASQIAEKTGVTQQFTQKILRRLTDADIVASHKGAKGGYTLKRDRTEITLLEVVETICGTLAVSRCQHTPYECTHPKGECCYRDIFADVSAYMREKFRSVTF